MKEELVTCRFKQSFDVVLSLTVLPEDGLFDGFADGPGVEGFRGEEG